MSQHTVFCSWPGCGYPGGPMDANPAGNRITTGMSFYAAIPGRVLNLNGFKWEAGGTWFTMGLWRGDGGLVGFGTASLEWTSAWVASPVGLRITPGQEYVVTSYHAPAPHWGYYSENPGMFNAGMYANHPLYAWAGRYVWYPSHLFPTNVSGSWYANDILFENQPPVWNTAATANASRGVYFSQSFAADYMYFVPSSYTAIGGALPPGLSLNAANGFITGTPTVGGIFDVLMRASNAEGTSDRWIQIVVSPFARLENFGMTGMVRH